MTTGRPGYEVCQCACEAHGCGCCFTCGNCSQRRIPQHARTNHELICPSPKKKPLTQAEPLRAADCPYAGPSRVATARPVIIGEGLVATAGWPAWMPDRSY
jgi:hypothetical protein